MSDCHLYKLPNELLLYMLAPLPTPQLLPLTVLSQRIYAIILRILQNRLIAASKLQSHSLLLECYHPSAKLTEPPYFCTYLGTDGLSRYEDVPEEDQNAPRRLGEMRNLYSHFRPYRRELENGGRRVRARPGDIPGSRTFPGTVSDNYQGETVKQVLNLEGHELFTQLVSQTNLVKIGPVNGLFTSFVDVEEGVVRVWRDWLREMAGRRDSVVSNQDMVEGEQEGKGKEAVRDAPGNKRSINDRNILWVSSSKTSGLRFNVKERKINRDMPILLAADEEVPVSYEIEFDELLVRTSHLVLTLEESMVRQDNSTGKAVVFGSFG